MMSPDVSSMSWDIGCDTFIFGSLGLISGASLHEETGKCGLGGETLQMASPVTSVTCVTASDDPLSSQV